MKKYVKPDLYYENFELCHYATGCATALNHTEDQCSLESSEVPDLYLGPSETIFNDACSIKAADWEDFCYFTGDATYIVFTS